MSNEITNFYSFTELFFSLDITADGTVGAAYVYNLMDGVWGLMQTLTSVRGEFSCFGFSSYMHNGSLIVGAIGNLPGADQPAVPAVSGTMCDIVVSFWFY